MTTAARDLHLTQSGISQHMKSLEDVLGVKLFDRINQRLVPTNAGNLLFRECSEDLVRIEKTLLNIKGGDKEVAGTIAIGLPIEFGKQIILPRLAKFGKANPLVHCKIVLDYASVFNEQIMDGAIDFAFVDQYKMDKRIKTEEVYRETLELCIREDLISKSKKILNRRKFYESLQFIDYQDDQPILRMWFDHHLNTKNINLNVRATVMDVQAVSKLIVEGLGAAVIPNYITEKLIKDGHKIYRFKGCGEPLANRISIAYMPGKSYSLAAISLMKWLKDSVNSK